MAPLDSTLREAAWPRDCHTRHGSPGERVLVMIGGKRQLSRAARARGDDRQSSQRSCRLRARAHFCSPFEPFLVRLQRVEYDLIGGRALANHRREPQCCLGLEIGDLAFQTRDDCGTRLRPPHRDRQGRGQVAWRLCAHIERCEPSRVVSSRGI